MLDISNFFSFVYIIELCKSDMEYVIELLEAEKRQIGQKIRNQRLMEKDMKKAVTELAKVTEIKKAIKILKLKTNKYKKLNDEDHTSTSGTALR